MLEDQRLLRRLRGGDKDALRQIYEKYIDDLLRVAISLLYDIQAAEDCLHDVFVNFAGSVDELRACRNIRPWSLGVS
jgi:DNA-directed RNA polymerase specialized sigma24 family protein